MGNKSSSEASIARASTDERKQTEPGSFHYGAMDEQTDGNHSVYDTAGESGETMKQLEGIQRDLKADSHPSNVLNQFSKLVLLDGSDKMSNFPEMVDQMGQQWQGIVEQEDLIVQHLPGGREDMDKLKGLRTDYFFLLLETKVVISGLVKQSKLRREDIEDILEVVKSTRDQKEHTLSESDQVLFKGAMHKLVKWIDESELVAITEKWKAMLKRLQAEKSKFEEVMEQMEKFKRKLGWSHLKAWKRCIIGFGALGVLLAGIGLAVASVITCGVTAAVAGIVMAGAVGVLVLNAHDVYSCLKPKTPEVVEKIEQITQMLQSYITAGRKIMKEVNNMKGIAKDAKIQAQDRMNESQCRTIERSVKNLDAHLVEYMQQGNKAIRVIDEACAEFIEQ